MFVGWTVYVIANAVQGQKEKEKRENDLKEAECEAVRQEQKHYQDERDLVLAEGKASALRNLLVKEGLDHVTIHVAFHGDGTPYLQLKAPNSLQKQKAAEITTAFLKKPEEEDSSMAQPVAIRHAGALLGNFKVAVVETMLHNHQLTGGDYYFDDAAKQWRPLEEHPVLGLRA